MTNPSDAAVAHPIQPLVLDDKGVLRFKKNAIVRHLLDHGGISLNDIACMDFSREDQEQFAQLIGYSHSGAGDLSYVSDQVWYAAQEEYEKREANNPPETVYCNRCRCHWPVGKHCQGNPPDDPCPLRPK